MPRRLAYDSVALPPGPLLICQLEGGIAWLVLKRPHRQNRLDAALAAELREACTRLAQNDELRVVVLRGEGEDFCAGTEEIPSKETAQGHIVQTSAASAIAAIPVPVVAAIQGQALDQGLELTLACDLRLAASSAQLGLTQIARGLIPWDGGTQRLPKLIGRSRALEMLLTGRILEAAESARIGLVHQVVAQDQLMPVTRSWAQQLAQRAPVALRYVKEAAHKGLDLTLDQGLRLEADLSFLLFSTQDREEGLKAWRGKQPPQFQGR
ncbi:MAG: enoyl-CoA hydratase/isomerase family protein [Chloroflexi bacterium]|nr:enoyl-CoA hydratase/isomerase family protein [Chloroflexota bacterium]